MGFVWEDRAFRGKSGISGLASRPQRPSGNPGEESSGRMRPYVKTGSAILALLALSAPAGVLAEEIDYDQRMGMMGVYVDPDEDRVANEDGTGVQFLYGWRLKDDLWLEGRLFGSVLDTGVDGFTDFYQYGGGADLMYSFGEELGLNPFVIGGVGVLRNDVVPDSEDDTGITANVGLGLMSPRLGSSDLRLRGEVRYVYDDFDDGKEDLRVGLGVVIPVGLTRTVEVEKVVEKKVVVEKEIPQADSDNDGVVDGVDRCPNTIPDAEVDQFGCAKKDQVVELKGVHFAFDKAELHPDSRVILDRAVLAFEGQPGMTVEVAGHTDSVGSEDYNQGLSERRAQEVVRYLVDRGVDPSRLEARGYGESEPRVSNDTESGRELNRRVEFRILTK